MIDPWEWIGWIVLGYVVVAVTFWLWEIVTSPWTQVVVEELGRRHPWWRDPSRGRWTKAALLGLALLLIAMAWPMWLLLAVWDRLRGEG